MQGSDHLIGSRRKSKVGEGDFSPPFVCFLFDMTHNALSDQFDVGLAGWDVFMASVHLVVPSGLFALGAFAAFPRLLPVEHAAQGVAGMQSLDDMVIGAVGFYAQLVLLVK